MVYIVSLEKNPHFFDEFMDNYYEEYKTFFAPKPKSEIKQFYKNKMNKIFIAHINNHFIGAYSIHRCLIADVYILPKYRNKGLGRILINDAKKRLFYCWRYELYTEQKNVGFYEKFGFKVNTSHQNRIQMVCYNLWLIYILIILTLFAI